MKITVISKGLFIVYLTIALGCTGQQQSKPVRKIQKFISDTFVLKTYFSNSNILDVPNVDSIKINRKNPDSTIVYYYCLGRGLVHYKVTPDSGAATEENAGTTMDIRGKLILDNKGALMSHTKDTLPRFYSSGCGQKDEKHTLMEQGGPGGSPPKESKWWFPYPDHGAVIESVEFRCDSIALLDQPRGEQLLLIVNTKSLLLKCDMVTDIEVAERSSHRYGHVLDSRRKDGYWVLIDEDFSTRESTGEQGYSAEHFTIFLINKTNKYRSVYDHYVAPADIVVKPYRADRL